MKAAGVPCVPGSVMGVIEDYLLIVKRWPKKTGLSYDS